VNSEQGDSEKTEGKGRSRAVACPAQSGGTGHPEMEKRREEKTEEDEA
jgi:hypothetical protein